MKEMKKLIIFLGIIALALMPVSCSLDETSYTEMEKNSYLNDAGEAEIGRAHV